jgi:hypothetical protein
MGKQRGKPRSTADLPDARGRKAVPPVESGLPDSHA